MKDKTRLLLQLIISLCVTLSSIKAQAQNSERMIRIAKIKIDSAQVDAYSALLKEHAEIAVRVEPGVIMLYAVHDENDPTNVTVFEIYANTAAYQSHLQAPHFKKYKAETANMVKRLELVDVTPITLQQKKRLN